MVAQTDVENVLNASASLLDSIPGAVRGDANSQQALQAAALGLISAVTNSGVAGQASNG
jgi:hypothetical protein